ncbi:export protein FliQ family 3 [Isosphaera pallida ATCC 43644]|jgi:flagellar biosynthesis protein FliQ|uniref:Export protein FliQ family 3 n=1 Tax=Isosphaera pallida (strain ATCC 43644 / DSM 9630 / IS1B) TaxID=575540 RepID=E8R6I5_ISOPI|nr:flagellar biosynthetic protein FliQ [Isosphaera pallida]ADV62896.1 export protein FliQ family 3 [Isosphaera pallida ATCC 43644]
MDATTATQWTRDAILMAFWLGGPLLTVGLVVGLVVGAMQTMTQLNDPVVGLVPRLLAIAAAIFALAPWMAATWGTFAARLIESLPDYLL